MIEKIDHRWTFNLAADLFLAKPFSSRKSLKLLMAKRSRNRSRLFKQMANGGREPRNQMVALWEQDLPQPIWHDGVRSGWGGTHNDHDSRNGMAFAKDMMIGTLLATDPALVRQASLSEQQQVRKILRGILPVSVRRGRPPSCP